MDTYGLLIFSQRPPGRNSSTESGCSWLCRVTPVIGNWKIQQPQLSNTTRNLELSIQNEHTEWQIIYPHVADIAAGEGFSSLVAVWRSIAVAEKYHEKRFRAMLQNVQAGTELEAFYQSLIKTTGKTAAVRCESCGYVAEDGIIPAFCPVCGMGSDQFKKLGNE